MTTKLDYAASRFFTGGVTNFFCCAMGAGSAQSPTAGCGDRFLQSSEGKLAAHDAARADMHVN
jgi:hypothetical protein